MTVGMPKRATSEASWNGLEGRRWGMAPVSAIASSYTSMKVVVERDSFGPFGAMRSLTPSGYLTS
jgi:hypothetical protein